LLVVAVAPAPFQEVEDVELRVTVLTNDSDIGERPEFAED